MLQNGYAHICEIDSDNGIIFTFSNFHIANDDQFECSFETIGELNVDLENHYDVLFCFGEQYIIFDSVILRSTSKSWQSDGQDTDGLMSVVFEYKHIAHYMGITKFDSYSNLPFKIKTDLERIKLLES